MNQAQEAKVKTEEATEDEQRQIAMLEAATNTENTTFQGVTIPAGFAPTRIEGESTINEGLVMVDSEGNSYVWIEVPKTKEVYKTAGLTITDFSEKEDSSTWGNYQKANFTITHGKYSYQSYERFNVATKENPFVKLALDKGGILLTTGATKRNSVLNIYDIGGNVNEWTLEKYLNDELNPCVARGGACTDGVGAYVSKHWMTVLDFEWTVIMGGRSTLY